MKKLFNYFMVAALMLTLNVALVSADDSVEVTEGGDTDATVTVGDVDVPVYNVIISWYNFTFDWKYDSTTNQHGWRTHGTCTAYDTTNTASVLAEDPNFFNYYSFFEDNACTRPISGQEVAEAMQTGAIFYYYVYESPHAGEGLGYIIIEDMSEAGYAAPSLSWTPESKYDFTTASFTYEKVVPVCEEIDLATFDYVTEAYATSDCTGEKVSTANPQEGAKFYEFLHGRQDIQYTGGEIPFDARSSVVGGGIYDPNLNNTWKTNYDIHLELGVDTTKTITTPTANDTIGTVTITITTH